MQDYVLKISARDVGSEDKLMKKALNVDIMMEDQLGLFKKLGQKREFRIQH